MGEAMTDGEILALADRLRVATVRFASESQDEAKVRRNKAIADAEAALRQLVEERREFVKAPRL